MSSDGRVSYARLLANREFSALLLAQVLSGLGDQVARIALALLVLERSGSASASAATFAVSYLPLLFGGTLLGPLADRFPRRTVLLVSDWVRALLILLLAVLSGGATPIVVLLLVLFLAELLTPVFDAAWAAMLPDVLPDGRDYLVGSGLLRTLHLLQQVAGLAAGALVVAVLGVQGSLIFNAASFVVSLVLLAAFVRKRPSPRSEGPRSSLVEDFTVGVRDLFGDPVRRMLVAVGWGSVIAMIVPMAVALPYAAQVAGQASLGALLMAATVGGAAIGAVVVSRRPPQRQIDLILPLCTAACVPLLIVAVAPPLPLALPLWALSGAATGFLVPLIGTIALLTSPTMRGRVMAFAGAGYNGLVAITYLLAGLMADATSPSATVTVAGVVGLLMVALARIYWPTRAVRRAVNEAYAEQPLAEPVADEVIDALLDDEGVPIHTSVPEDPEPEPLPPREERIRERTYVPTIEIVLPQRPVDADLGSGAGPGIPGIDPRAPY
jgi:MFS family permease